MATSPWRTAELAGEVVGDHAPCWRDLHADSELLFAASVNGMVQSSLLALLHATIVHATIAPARHYA